MVQDRLESGLCFIEVSPHTDVLRSLPREEKRNVRGRLVGSRVSRDIKRSKLRLHVLDRLGGKAHAVGEVAPSDMAGVTDIAQGHVGVGAKKVTIGLE